MANYHRLHLATLIVDFPDGPQTILGVSHFEQGASTHIAEVLESHGFSPSQIGRMLDRVRVTEMGRKSMGCTLTLPGALKNPFGRRA